MKVLFFWLLILSVAPFCIYAQDEAIRINGRIIDKVNGVPLAYASLTVRDSPQGTVSNVNGQFEIVIKANETNDSLVASMLGYESKSFLISSINKETEFVIQLTEKVIQLEEVTIEEERISGEDYLALAFKKHKENIPVVDYILSVFFRETAKLDDEYFSLLEAAGRLISEKQNRGHLDVNIDEIRLALGKLPDVPVIGEDYNPFRELNASFTFKRRVAPCQKCRYEVEEYSSFQDSPIVVVSSYKNPERTSEGYMKFYIDLEDYGIWRFEFATVIPFGVGLPKALEGGTNSTLVFLSRRIDYIKVDEKYYLHQYHQVAKHSYENQNDKKRYATEHFFDLLVNDVRGNELKSIRAENRMSYKHSLSAHAKKYNPTFWKTYNIIKQSPLDQQVVDDLKKSVGKKDIFD